MDRKRKRRSLKNHNTQSPLSHLLIEKLKQALLSKKLALSLEKKLKSFGFSNPQTAFRNLLTLSENPVAQQDFFEILIYLLELLQKSPSCDLSLNHFERFCANVSSPSRLYTFLKKAPRSFEMIIRLFGTSPALSQTLIRNPEYFDWLYDPFVLDRTWGKEDFHNEIDAVLEQTQYSTSALNTLRRFKRRQMLRIGVRDMLSLSDLEETTRDISFLADVCLEWAMRVAYRELKVKFGEPQCETNVSQLSSFVVIGMGKLGGLELNYSSDIDVMFVYLEEGKSSGGSEKSIDNHRFFTRLAERMLQILSSMTSEGTVYRVDTRLRPEGATGPLVRSLESFEHYYATWGRAWERQALIKARAVAGDIALGEHFLKTLNPFIYRRYMDYQAIEEMKAIKLRIEEEVTRKGENARDVKLGVGGIREIEFGVQILQLLYGGKIESLRQRGTLGAIRSLQQEGLLKKEDVDLLKEAYVFLRRVEHLLQLEQERQTHVLPEDLERLDLLARRLGYASKEKFLEQHQAYTKKVHSFYQNVFSDLQASKRTENPLAHFFETGELTDEEKKVFQNLGFKDIESAARNFLSLSRGQDYTHISSETLRDFMNFLPILLKALEKSFDPDQSLIGLERFITSYQTRSGFFQTLQSSEKLCELLVLLFGLSPFLGDILIRNPHFFDFVASGMFEENYFEETGHDCMHILEKTHDFEKKILMLREYRDLEILKEGLRDILGLHVSMQVIEGLNLLAERVMICAFEISKNFFEEKYHRLCPSLAVIGLGKLGAHELNYASDLDVLFVGPENQEQLQEASRLANIFMDVLSGKMTGKALYEVDTRLRPDGSKGPLVPSLGACRDYYQASNAIWERMAFTKARFIVGDETLGNAAIHLLSQFVFQNLPMTTQVEEIKSLREQIFQERCKDLPEGFEVKSGIGGLLDIEFLAQFLQLKWGQEHPELRQSHTLILLQRLASSGILPQEEVGLLVEAYLFYRDIESTLRLVQDRSTNFIPHDPEWARKIQKKMGLEVNPEKFFERLEHFSRNVRYLYMKYLK